MLAKFASAQTVYVAEYGTKYHSSKECQYLKNSVTITSLTKTDATDKNYTACSVCYNTTPTTSVKAPSLATQCTGTTAAGARCKRTTTSSTGRCYQH